MIRALVLSAVLCAACKSDGASSDETLETPTAAPKKGSAGGFSATLSAELADGSDGKGERTAGTATGAASSGSTTADSKPATDATPPGPKTGADAGSAKPATTTDAKPAQTGAGSGSAKPATTDTKPALAGAGSGSAKPATTDPKPALAGAGSGSAKPATMTAGAGSAKPVTPVIAPPPAKVVELTPELKAIKLSLLPNWKRDADEPATFSLFVDVQSRGETQVFRFHYGYDDPRAPSDRDAYKKFLTDAKIFTVRADRQLGGSWLLEGDDSQGHAGFRMLVTYGGKRLVCYGSLYKDSPFGDIRDEVIIQAKKICETIQL